MTLLHVADFVYLYSMEMIKKKKTFDSELSYNQASEIIRKEFEDAYNNASNQNTPQWLLDEYNIIHISDF